MVTLPIKNSEEFFEISPIEITIKELTDEALVDKHLSIGHILTGDKKKIDPHPCLPFDPVAWFHQWPNINNMRPLIRLLSTPTFSAILWIYFLPAAIEYSLKINFN